jgi:GNAT superfamily N-acetyltransferase
VAEGDGCAPPAEIQWQHARVIPTLATMAYEVRELDVHDDAHMHRMYEIVHAALLFERPDAPIWSESENTRMFREGDPTETFTALGAFDAGAMVGAAFVILPQLANLEKAFVEVAVEPELRRRGIGSALVDYLAAWSRRAGRTVMLSQASYAFDRRDDHPYLLFAEKNGFKLALTQVRRDLQLPVADEQIQAWINEVSPHHDGYSFATYEGMLPDHLLESFLYASNQIAVDAPQGDESWEPEGVTPAAFKIRYENDLKAGRKVYITVAVDDAADDVVAFSTFAVVPNEEPFAYQWGTLVRAEHRGHRLGLAVKARSLANLQRLHPDRTVVTTCNAEVNAQMVGINERMGFKPVEILGEFQRLLD